MRHASRAALLLTVSLALVVAGVLAAPASTGPTAARQSAEQVQPAAVRPGAWCVGEARCRLLGLDPASELRVQPRPDLAVVQRARALGAEPCDDGSGAVCGTLEVPQDYDRPGGDTLTVAWQLFPHSAPGPAVSTTTYIGGGPGSSTIQDAGGALFMLGGLLDTHDLLLVDQRGRGASEAIRCQSLQHATGTFWRAVRQCTRQLGDRIDDYASANNARDLEAVRAALGIDQLDLFGLSYGGMDSVAYAGRFPDHVRSVVLASSVGPSSLRFRTNLRRQATLSRRVFSGLCEGSPSCRRTIEHPRALLAWGARFLRHHPFTGFGDDPAGNRLRVFVNETTLAQIAVTTDAAVTFPGDLGAALRSLRAGNRKPILRLTAAAKSFYVWQDSGPANQFSFGALLATACADARPLPWADGLTRAERVRAARRSAAAIPPGAIAPWRARSLMRHPVKVFSNELGLCLSWPDVPDADRLLPRGSELPDVPVLAITGEYDGNVTPEDTIALAEMFPDHQLLDVGKVPHVASFFRCAPRRTQAFIDGLGPVGSTCAPRSALHWFVQPSFPEHAADAVPLRVGHPRKDHSTPRIRHLAGAAWQAVLDAWILTFRRDLTTSPGLYGGRLTDSANGRAYFIDFDRFRFTRDLAISGSLRQPFSGADTVARLRVVDGPRGVTGRLVLRIDFALERSGPFELTGTLAGRHVDLVGNSR